MFNIEVLKAVHYLVLTITAVVGFFNNWGANNFSCRRCCQCNCLWTQNVPFNRLTETIMMITTPSSPQAVFSQMSNMWIFLWMKSVMSLRPAHLGTNPGTNTILKYFGVFFCHSLSTLCHLFSFWIMERLNEWLCSEWNISLLLIKYCI